MFIKHGLTKLVGRETTGRDELGERKIGSTPVSSIQFDPILGLLWVKRLDFKKVIEIVHFLDMQRRKSTYVRIVSLEFW